MATGVFLALRAAGVALLLDVTDGRLPAVVHWGADLGDVTADEVEGLLRTGVRPIAANVVDESVRLALLPEHWTGWVGRPGISGSRAGRDWSPKFTTSAVRVDRELVTGVINTGPARVEVEATDEVAQLELLIMVELTVGGLVRVQATLTNSAPEPYQLDDLVLTLPVPGVASEIVDLAGHWGKERIPQRHEMTVGVHLREGRKGRTGPDAATVLHLGTPGFSFASGEAWGLHTGWSGNHTHYAERLSTGEQVIGGGELLLPGELILAAGASYTSPWIYGSYGLGLDAVARRFHRYLRSRASHPSPQRPVTLNVWEAVYFDHDLGRLVELADQAAAIGVERYVLDDGWFGSRRDDHSGLGDWSVSRDVWPDGLHPLVTKVHQLGMQFGLWVEPEMVNVDSGVARAHPEWIMATGHRLPVESRHQQVINLGIEECYAYIREALFAILAEYRIGYLKWDHNRDLVDAGTAPGGRPGGHEQTLACYRLMDEIKAAHPGLEIESCSSGGARVDLGVLMRTDRVWVSDCIDPLERQQMNRWTTQLIPPELMGSHIASGRSHTTGRVHDLSFRAGTAVFGHLGIEWDLTRASEAERADLAAWVTFFKAHRALLLDGDLVRMDLPDPTVCGHGVVAYDRSEAIYSYASIAQSEVVLPGRLRFPGLDPDRRYRIAPVLVGRPPSGLRPPLWWAEGVTMSGAALAFAGVMAPVVDPDQVVLYRAVGWTSEAGAHRPAGMRTEP